MSQKLIFKPTWIYSQNLQNTIKTFKMTKNALESSKMTKISLKTYKMKEVLQKISKFIKIQSKTSKYPWNLENYQITLGISKMANSSLKLFKWSKYHVFVKNDINIPKTSKITNIPLHPLIRLKYHQNDKIPPKKNQNDKNTSWNI